MVDLKIVPKREPDAAEVVRSRIRRMPRPDGLLQCPECGGRSVCSVENGVSVKAGKRKGGTNIVKDACDDCRQTKGRIVKMRTGDEKPIRLK